MVMGKPGKAFPTNQLFRKAPVDCLKNLGQSLNIAGTNLFSFCNEISGTIRTPDVNETYLVDKLLIHIDTSVSTLVNS